MTLIQTANNSFNSLRLPRFIEKEKKDKQVLSILEEHLSFFKDNKEFAVPVFDLNRELTDSINSARRSGYLIRGLESAKEKLDSEKKGISIAWAKTGESAPGRVSRLIITANSGSERFYRNVTSLMKEHSPRVLVTALDVTGDTLGEKIFGPGHRALLLLLSHKDAVTDLLLALR